MLLRVIVVVQRYCSFFVVWDLVVFLFSFFFSSLFLYFFFFCLRLRNMSRLSWWVASLFLVDFPFLLACLSRLSVCCVACRIFSGGARARCVPIFPQAGGTLFLPLFGLPLLFLPGIIFLGTCFLLIFFPLPFLLCLPFLSLSMHVGCWRGYVVFGVSSTMAWHGTPLSTLFTALRCINSTV